MLTCVVPHGIMVVELDTLKPRLMVSFPESITMKCADHYGTTQILYFVSKQDPASLQMWDDDRRRILRKIEMPSEIVRIHSHYISNHAGYISVILENEVRVFDPSLRNCLRSIVTYKNPGGLCIFSENKNSLVLPGTEIGELRWMLPATSSSPRADTEPVKCHENELQCIAVNSDGTLLATTSMRGTLIRLFSVSDDRELNMIREFRRGSSPVAMSHLCFSHDSQLLAVISDKNTLHIFYLGHQTHNNYSSLWLLKPMSAYFASEWSMLQIYIPDAPNTTFKCTFVHDSTFTNEYSLYVVGNNGMLYDYSVILPSADEKTVTPTFIEKRRVKITF